MDLVVLDAGPIRHSERQPPIVVARTDRGHGLGIIDLNRAYAHWLEGHPRIQAYELLLGYIPGHWRRRI
jgi:hypothetical protein